MPCQLLYPGLCAEVVCALQLQSWADTFASSSCNKSTSTRRQVLALFSEKERYEFSFDKWQLNPTTTSEEGVDIFSIASSNFLLRAVWHSVPPFRNSLEGPSIYSVTLPYQKKKKHFQHPNSKAPQIRSKDHCTLLSCKLVAGSLLTCRAQTQCCIVDWLSLNQYNSEGN